MRLSSVSYWCGTWRAVEYRCVSEEGGAFKRDTQQSVNSCYYEDLGIEMQAPVKRIKRIRLYKANQATNRRL